MGERSFRCEVEQPSAAAAVGVTRVVCQGELVAGTTDRIKDVVKLLIAEGAHIVVDCEGVSYVDSMGLGAMVGLKTSAAKASDCKLEFVNLSNRVQQVVRITGLAGLFQL